MISGLYTALSGLNAFQRKIHTTANNLANVETDGFKKSQVTLEQTAPQGVQARIEKINTPGPLVLTPTPEGENLIEKSNVDISEEITNLLAGQRAYEANLRTVKVADESLGSLLDIVEK